MLPLNLKPMQGWSNEWGGNGVIQFPFACSEWLAIVKGTLDLLLFPRVALMQPASHGFVVGPDTL